MHMCMYLHVCQHVCIRQTCTHALDTAQGAIDPTGSSGFTDDTPLHTDGPDAVPTMAILVTKPADYLQWAGMEIHLKK